MEAPSGERLRGKRQVWCLLQVCDPCLSALEWFVYHTRRNTSARIYLYLYLIIQDVAIDKCFCTVVEHLR